MKKQTPEQYLEKEIGNMEREFSKWKSTLEAGCSDPFWPDGVNLNLIRNHIIYAKRKIMTLCQEFMLPLPNNYYRPTPPEVDHNYMANLKQTERVERMRKSGHILVRNKPVYNEEQFTFL